MKEFKKEVYQNGDVKEYVVTKERDEHHDEVETVTEIGFDNALVLSINHSYNFNTLYVTKEIVAEDLVRSAYSLYTEDGGDFSDDELWLLRDSYYWLVRRANGSLYPFPLLFSSQEERVASAHRYNDQQWDAFYSGGLPSPKLVDVPSNEEINQLLQQLKFHVAQGASPWDDLDARGGLIPRWAA